MKPRVKIPESGEVIAVPYSLDECTSAQETAAVAGIALLAQWLAENEHAGSFICRDLTERGYTLEVDPEGLWAARDALYETSMVKIKISKDEEKEVRLPSCPVIRDLDPSPTGAYLSLYQRGIYSTIYKRALQRVEFDNRAPGGAGEASLGEQLKLLVRPDDPVTVTSTLLWGANRQPDGKHKAHIVSGKMAFALQAKLLVLGLYPLETTTDTKGVPCRQGQYWHQNGWVMVVPDIFDLAGFLRSFKVDCAFRSTETRAGSTYPERAKVVHIEEAICEYSLGVRGKVFALEATHLFPLGNECGNGQLLRAKPSEDRVNEYLRSREEDGKVLRWARAEASMTGEDAETLFAGAALVMAPEQTLESFFYQQDARRLLEEARDGR